MKRLGLAVIIMAALVFGSESILTLLRQRNVNVSIEVKDQKPDDKPKPGSIMTIAPDSTLLARVVWDYKIGPRFPDTIVHVDVTDQGTGKVVASNEYKIDCGMESLNCGGTTPLALDYGVQNREGTRAVWPAGEYRVQVTRTFVGFKPVPVIDMPLRVAATQ
jgi:hypothetical protein